MIAVALWSVAALLALAPAGIALSVRPRGSVVLYGACLVITAALCATALLHSVGIGLGLAIRNRRMVHFVGAAISLAGVAILAAS